MAGSWTLTARAVFPVSSPPLEEGLLTIAGQDIVALEPRGDRQADVDLGQSAVIPGLVNAHTHLDLTGLRGLAPWTGSFPSWLQSVIRHRQGRSSLHVDQDIRTGIRECLVHGVTLVADVAGDGRSWPLLAGAPLRSVVFHELLGLTRARAGQSWAALLEWLRLHSATQSCRPGISPHAPYSVRSALFRAAAGLAGRRGLPIMIHLAETTAELELLSSHQGPFVPFLQQVGVWDPTGLVTGPSQVLELSAAAPQLLLAHGNYLDPGLLLPPGATVIYCPRTHDFFAHRPHAFRDLLASGVQVVLGTDSLASAPDLDILAEARFLHSKFPDLPGSALLNMITLAGAQALGWGAITGSLGPGKSADLVVLPITADPGNDPHDLIWTALPPRQVLFRGNWVTGFPP